MHTHSLAQLLLKECISEQCSAQYRLEQHFPFFLNYASSFPNADRTERRQRAAAADPGSKENSKSDHLPILLSAVCGRFCSQCIW